MTISFAPTKAGAAKGFTAGMWSGVPFTVQLKGNDTQQFLISPTSFDFGNVPLGSHAPQQIVNVTNIGTTSVVMSGAGGGAGQFGGSQDCQGQTIAPGATCHMYYQFLAHVPRRRDRQHRRRLERAELRVHVQRQWHSAFSDLADGVRFR